MDDIQLSLGFQIGDVFKLVGKHTAKAMQATGIVLTIEQFVLLNMINAKEEITQHELSRLLNKDKSGILRLTDELEKKKMVVRIVEASDRRKKVLVLTKKGVETLNKLLEIRARSISELFSGVSKKEIAIFSKVLTKIQDNGKK